MTLSAEGLAYRYARGSREAVGGIDLRVRAGTVMAVIGPNGCGKSTLLELLMGALKPLRGIMRIDGADIANMDRSSLSGAIAYLPQYERMSFSLTAAEYALLGRTPHVGPFSLPSGDEEAAAVAALARVGMAVARDRPVNELSGGELQLVRLARCLAQDTPCIVMDEPTTMLDPANALAFGRLVRGMAGNGKTIALSTHDIAFASFVSDEASLMREGRLTAGGPSRSVLAPEALSACFGAAFGHGTAPSVFAQAGSAPRE